MLWRGLGHASDRPRLHKGLACLPRLLLICLQRIPKYLPYMLAGLTNTIRRPLTRAFQFNNSPVGH